MRMPPGPRVPKGPPCPVQVSLPHHELLMFLSDSSFCVHIKKSLLLGEGPMISLCDQRSHPNEAARSPV